FRKKVNNWVGCLRLELGRIGPSQTTNMAGKFNNRALETKADSQIGYFLFPGITGGGDFPFNSAVAETTRDENGIHPDKILLRPVAFDLFGVNPMDPNGGFVGHPGMV